MASGKKITIKLFCSSLSKVVSYVARDDQRLDLGSIASTFGLDPWSLKLNGHFISRGPDLISSSLTWNSLLSFFSSRSLPTGAHDSSPLLVDGKLCRPGCKRPHDPADVHEDVIASSKPQLEDSLKKIKLRDTNSGCKDEDNLLTKCNGFGLKRKQSVGDANQPKKSRVHTTESGQNMNNRRRTRSMQPPRVRMCSSISGADSQGDGSSPASAPPRMGMTSSSPIYPSPPSSAATTSTEAPSSDNPSEPSQRSPDTVEGPLPGSVGVDGRIYIVIAGKQFIPSSTCSRTMTGTFKERLEFNGYLWKNISQETKMFYFREFQKSFYWNSSIDHLVYGVWEKRARVRYKDFLNKLHAKGERPRYISEDIWANWMQYWSSSEAVTIVDQNSTNRKGGLEGDSVSIHTGGTLSHQEHADRLERVVESLQSRQMNGDNVDHARVYYEAVGGRDRRGRVFGLGSYANVCYSHASSSSAMASRLAATTNEVIELRSTVGVLMDRINRLEDFISRRLPVDPQAPSDRPHSPPS